MRLGRDCHLRAARLTTRAQLDRYRRRGHLHHDRRGLRRNHRRRGLRVPLSCQTTSWHERPAARHPAPARRPGGRALRGLAVAAEDLLGKAVQRAPLEEGTLRASAAIAYIVDGKRFEGSAALAAAEALVRVTAARTTIVNIEAEVSFNTVYAARQHRGKPSGSTRSLLGEAKYLERPALENAGRYRQVILLSAAKSARL